MTRKLLTVMGHSLFLWTADIVGVIMITASAQQSGSFHSERNHCGIAGLCYLLLTLSPVSTLFIPTLLTPPNPTPHLSQCKPFVCKRSIRKSLRMRCSISSAASSAFCLDPSGSGAIMIIMTSAPLQRSSYRRPGARRQGYRVTGPSEPRRIIRSRTRDS